MKKTAVIILHAGYWAIYVLLILILMQFNYHRQPSLWLRFLEFFRSVQGILFLAPAILGFYSFYAVLFPRFFQRKRMVAFGFAAAGTAVVIGFCCWASLGLVNLSLIRHDVFSRQMSIVFFLSMLAGIHGIIGLVIKGFVSWYEESKMRALLTERNHQVELELVKSQLHPHFLFNTINNIDMLIALDAPKASLYLNQLSDLMRFILYETKSDYIPLEKELTYIEKYIALQKIRTTNENYVDFSVRGQPGDIMIAPMLLIPYIENAFKHAADKNRTHAIRIRLDIDRHSIRFCCENAYRQGTSRHGLNPGIGNELLQKRLALLYPGRHMLRITQENGYYTVHLTLQHHEN